MEKQNGSNSTIVFNVCSTYAVVCIVTDDKITAGSEKIFMIFSVHLQMTEIIETEKFSCFKKYINQEQVWV